MEKNKDKIISRLREIRDIVKNDPEKRRSFVLSGIIIFFLIYFITKPKGG